MEENKQNAYIGKSKSFTLALVFTLIMSSFSINFDITSVIQKDNLEIPNWYLIVLAILDFSIVASIIAIYFYRKIGVYVLPIAIFIHFLLQNQFMNSFLYFDLFILFLYFSVILIAVVPRWPFFK